MARLASDMAMNPHRVAEFVVSVREVNGALGDLGTLLPLVLGAISIAGLAPTPILLGLTGFYLAAGPYYPASRSLCSR